MATICPRCRKLDNRAPDDTDGQCPHCGVLYAKARSPRTPPTPSTRINDNPALKMIGLGIAAVLALAIVYQFSGSTSAPPDPARAELSAARSLCYDALRGEVSDRTLRIQQFNIGDTRLPNDNILLNIPFSVENAFGHRPRQDARCQTTPDGTSVVSLGILR